MTRWFSDDIDERGYPTDPRHPANRIDRRPAAERLAAPMRRAWERDGDRAALFEAFDVHVRHGEALPDWLAQPVTEALGWWATNAPLKRRGRHAQWPTAYQERLARWAYADMVDEAHKHGRSRAQAIAMVADWFHVSEETVRTAHRQREKLPVLLGRAALSVLSTRRPWSEQEWRALLAKYPPRTGR